MYGRMAGKRGFRHITIRCKNTPASVEISSCLISSVRQSVRLLIDWPRVRSPHGVLFLFFVRPPPKKNSNNTRKDKKKSANKKYTHPHTQKRQD